MSKVSKIYVPRLEDALMQGDIFTNVEYNYIVAENEDNVEVEELEFPMAIIISQACDVTWMDKFIAENGGNATKYMPTVLMCPIYNYETLKEGKHLEDVLRVENYSSSNTKIYDRKDKDVAERNWHYRLHLFELVDQSGRMVLENMAIDFKHYFTVPIKYLYLNKDKRIYSLDNISAEQITLKFASYLSRVAIPE